MMKSRDPKVQNFLEEIMMLDHAKYQILQELRKTYFKHYPKAEERFMYGGIIFNYTEMAAGIFVRKNHLSFEFGTGYLFKDPDKLLEGGGKYRRHLKIKTKEDVQSKRVDFFVKQVGLVEK